MLISSLQLIVFSTYIIYIATRFGILESISDSTYYLRGQEKWYFLIFLWSLGVLNLFQGLELYGFLSTAGLFFTGITIKHKSFRAFTRSVHILGAVSAISLAMIGLALIHNMWWIFIPTIMSALVLIRDKNIIWWIEVVAFISIIIGYFLK